MFRFSRTCERGLILGGLCGSGCGAATLALWQIVALSLFLSMNVVFRFSIFLSPFSWKVFRVSCTVSVPSMVSSPYMSCASTVAL